MTIKNIVVIFLINLLLTQAIAGDKQNHHKYRQYRTPRVLSQQEKNDFVRKIRSIFKELGFPSWETVQIHIVNGWDAATRYDTAGVFKGFIIGHCYYGVPRTWLKAILAHELIHWEKNHGAVGSHYKLVYESVFISLLLRSIRTASTESRRAGFLLFTKGWPLLFFLNQMRLLHTRQQEQEADMVSTKRWGTAKMLINYMHYSFNREQYELSLRHKCRFVELSIEDMIKRAEKPSLRDSLHNCLHYLFDEHPTGPQRVAYLYPIAQRQEQANRH